MGMLLRRHYEENNNNDHQGAAIKSAPVPDKKVEKEKSIVNEIKSMSGAKLRKLAAENGIENPEELTAGELKALLVEKLG